MLKIVDTVFFCVRVCVCVSMCAFKKLIMQFYAARKVKSFKPGTRAEETHPSKRKC